MNATRTGVWPDEMHLRLLLSLSDPPPVTADDLRQACAAIDLERKTVRVERAERERLFLKLVNERERCTDLLCDLAAYLDRFVDVVDGSYGEQAPNEAMSLHTRVMALLCADCKGSGGRVEMGEAPFPTNAHGCVACGGSGRAL